MRPLIHLWLTAILLAASVAGADEAPRAGLEILIYGASGKVGVHVVTEALDRGHNVTAVSRDPAGIGGRHENLVVVAGDLLDRDSIAGLLAGKDVVITSVRGVVGKDKDPRQSLQYLAVTNLVAEIRNMNEGPRLIHVGGSGSLEVEPGVLWADKLPKLFIPKKLELEIEGQVLALEFLRTADDVRWTYATPPKNFTNGARTGNFRIGGDEVMEDERGRSRVSRADFAVAILDEAEFERHTGRRFSVAD